MIFRFKSPADCFYGRNTITIRKKAETPASAFVSLFYCYFNLFINSVLGIGVDIADAFFLRRNLAF